MTVNLSALAGAGQQFFDNNGNPLLGGKLWSYAAGTTTPQTTYTTAAGTPGTEHTNPIILDSAGRVPAGEIWLTAGSNYKFVLMTSTNVPLATWDNITGINGTGIASDASNVSFTGFDGQVGVVQDLADDDGSDWIGFNQAGAGAVARSAQDKMRDTVSVKDFGAVGDGVADDTVSVQAALTTGKSVYVPSGVYKITSTLTLSNGQMIFGDGGHLSKLDKAFNGDLIQASAGCVIDSLWLAGNGALRTGRGVLFGASTPRSIVQNCRIIDFDGACVEFTAPNAGSLFNMSTCEIYRTVLANPAIILPTDTQSAPRTFVSCYTTGGNFIDCGGGDNVLIEACHINTMSFSAGKKVLVVGTRIATVGATLTFSGLDSLLSGCAIAGPVEISGTASSMNMTGCVVAGGITLLSGAANCTVQNNQCTGAVVDNSGQSSNMVDIKLTSYTPTWTTSGTAPSLGDGSLIGRYSRTGNLVTVTIEFLAGSTTTFGTGDFRFSLPFTSAPTVQQVGTARLLDSGTAYWVGTAVASASSSFVRMFTTTSTAVSSTGPFVWANGDSLVLTITYTI